jgi:hypothetical protein
MTQVDPIPDSQSLISTRVKARKQGVHVYTKNPFWAPTEVKVGTRKVTIAGGLIESERTGEQLHLAGIHRVEHVDETQFVKLFTQNLKLFFDLSLGAQKILQVLLTELQKTPNADGTFLSWMVVEDFAQLHSLKISRNTYHRGLREMLDKNFIAESEHSNYYWINPNLFFNGDRMVFITEYRKFKRAKAKDESVTGDARGMQAIGNIPGK